MATFSKLSGTNNLSLFRTSSRCMACLAISQLLLFGLLLSSRHYATLIPQPARTIIMHSDTLTSSIRGLNNESSSFTMYEKQVDFLMNNRRKNENRVIELFQEFYRIHCQESTVGRGIQRTDLTWCPCVPDQLGRLSVIYIIGEEMKDNMKRVFC